MPTESDRYAVQRLIREGAVVIDVLPPAEYEDEHLAGAVNIPLKTLDRTTIAQLPRDRPLVVYCHDYQ